MKNKNSSFTTLHKRMFPISIKNGNIYHILSGIKCLLGASILLITYTTVNVYEDPGVGIGLSFLGIFIITRGISFFVFFLLEKHTHKELEHLTIIKESYKLSLLFGIYIIINYLLILLWRRNKIVGILLLGFFIWLEFTLYSETGEHHDRRKEKNA